jgi:FtsH-binding integral membrane protein
MAFNVARGAEHAYQMTAGGQRRPRNGEIDEETGEPGNEPPASPGFQKQVSHYNLEFDENLNLQHIKEGFIRKVYSILGLQMTYTSLLVAAMTFNPSLGAVGVYYANHSLLFLIPLICVVCGLSAQKDKYPINLILLFVLTTMISLPIGGICYVYYSMGKGAIILSSVVMTAIVFFALTAVVWIVGDKFGWMGKFLFVALPANILFSFFAYMMGWPQMYILYNVFGVLIFTGYILYDTNQIVNKVRLEDCDTGTAIMGAVELYLDIVNLFMHILSIMTRED